MESPSDEDRFWRYVDADGPLGALRPDLGPCWLWTGPFDSQGYAQCSWAGRRAPAARIAWEIAWGAPAPAGLRFARFACARRECVNPQHVRPKVAAEDDLGPRYLAEWNARHEHCVRGHAFTQANSLTVAGGRSCRQCRTDLARHRRKLSGPAG